MWCLQESLKKRQWQKKKKIWVTFPKRKRRAVTLLMGQLLISMSWGCLVPCSVHCVVCWRLEFNSMSHPLDFWRVFWGEGYGSVLSNRNGQWRYFILKARKQNNDCFSWVCTECRWKRVSAASLWKAEQAKELKGWTCFLLWGVYRDITVRKHC